MKTARPFSRITGILSRSAEFLKLIAWNRKFARRIGSVSNATQVSRGWLASTTQTVHWQRRIKAIQGYLSSREGLALKSLAAQGPGHGAIVEIGSFLGRSTVCLAAGSKEANREKVTAVDHFSGSPEHQLGGTAQSNLLQREGTTYNQFLRNLRAMNVENHVTPIVASSEQAIQQWHDPIRLLFIDGDHSYSACRRDFHLWSPFVIKGGLVCFHDVNAWPGVTAFYQELLQRNPGYNELTIVDSLGIVQKIAS